MSQALFERGEIAPHSQQAEEALLGSVLINPDAYLEVCDFITSDDFFILRNGWIWEAMERLYNRDDPIEYLTVVEELKAQDRLDDIGGSAYVTYLASNTATSLHVEAYAHIVERAAVRRRLLEASGEMTQLAREEDQDVGYVENESYAQLDYVFGRRQKGRQRDLLTLLSDAYDKANRSEGSEDPRGIPFFCDVLNLYFDEMPKRYFMVLAARGGVGKSRFAIQWALHAAMNGNRVVYFSAEVDPEEIIWTMISMASAASKETFIPFRYLQKGQLHLLSQEQQTAYLEITARLQQCRLEIFDARQMNARQVAITMRRLRQGVDFIIVDYLGELEAMPPLQGERFNAYQELEQRLRILRNLATETDALVLCIVQFNREAAKVSTPGIENFADSDEIGRKAFVAFSLTKKKGVLTIRCIKDRYLGIESKFVKMMMHPTFGTYFPLPPGEQNLEEIKEREINLENF